MLGTHSDAILQHLGEGEHIGPAARGGHHGVGGEGEHLALVPGQDVKATCQPSVAGNHHKVIPGNGDGGAVGDGGRGMRGEGPSYTTPSLSLVCTVIPYYFSNRCHNTSNLIPS